MSTAKSDLRLKLRLEQRFLSRLRGLFAAEVRDYRVGLGRGFVPDVQARFGESLEQILLSHYRSVSDVFAHMISKQLSADVKPTDEELAILDAKIEEVMTTRAVQQAAAIHRTTQKRMDSAPADAGRRLLDANGSPPTKAERDALAVSLLTTNLLGRVRTIACYETQWSSESSKVLEVTVLLDAEGGVEVKSQEELTVAKKRWQSQGDSRVRTLSDGSAFDHLAADGQVVPANQAFLVSGQTLMWPGDSSNGASLGNVINCRCSAIYDVEDIELLRRIIGREIVEDVPAFDFPITESEIIVGLNLPGEN